jgi:GLPGLI family protein
LSAKIGNNLIIYRLQFQNAQSSFRILETRKKNPKLDDGFMFSPNSVLTYKDHKHKKIYFQDQKKPELIAMDTLIYDLWTMVPEATKDILGYACQKAISEKHKDIAVWFSFDLPIPDGPLEFQGLPGAILAVESKKINYIAINITNTPASESVEMPKAEKYLSPKEFNQRRAKN